jgi:hypothetical protein
MEPVHSKEIRLVSILILFAGLVVAFGTAYPVQPGEIILPVQEDAARLSQY